jgi:hypothetical protein
MRKMLDPKKLAKIITEDININNGLIFEAWPDSLGKDEEIPAASDVPNEPGRHRESSKQEMQTAQKARSSKALKDVASPDIGIADQARAELGKTQATNIRRLGGVRPNISPNANKWAEQLFQELKEVEGLSELGKGVSLAGTPVHPAYRGKKKTQEVGH